MSEQTRIPNTPGRSEEAIRRRDRIRTAVIAMHDAIRPLLEVLDSKASISLRFRVAGDEVAITVKPGKPNDEER